METLIATLAVAALYGANLAAIAYAIARKRDAASALAWSLAIAFLPGIGLLAFLVFGLNRLPRRLHRVIKRRPVRSDGEPSGQVAYRAAHWEGIDRLACVLGAEPARGGNEVLLLHEGAETFEAIKEAISAARHHVHVEEYIFRDDALGRQLLELMIERAKAGIEVRLMVDAFGTGEAKRLIRDLKQAGGEGAVFLPLFPFGKIFTANLRNHRKIIVCDGEVGFLGGMNVGNEYFGRRWRNRYWCDAHLRLKGPAVTDLQRVFADDWRVAAGRDLEDGPYFPEVAAQGDSDVQIVASGPDQDENAMRGLLFAAITRASRKVRVSSPYLVPDSTLRDALKCAAARGVKVELLTQGHPPEIWLTYMCSRHYWEELLNAGVRIYQYGKGILHAKSVIVDDRWAALGSANLDNRSLRLNFEVAALLYGERDAAEANARFERDLADSEQVESESFNARPWHSRALESAARLAAPLL